MLLDSLLDLVFPPKCEVCRTAGKEAICPSCFAKIRFMKPHCGIHCVTTYDGVMKEALHRFKFKSRKNLAEPLGIALVKYLSQTPALNIQEIDVVIPVPLHPWRLRERGYNQVHLLADSLNKYYGIPVVPALLRTRATASQFDLPREKRFENVSGAFKVTDSQAVYNKRLLLLDDIYTTGATAAECAKTLKIAGAKRIEIMALSRAIC